MAVIGVLDILMRGDTKQLDAAFGKASKGAKKFQSDVGGINIFAKLESSATSSLGSIASKLAAPVAAFLTLEQVISHVSAKLTELSDMSKAAGRLGMDPSQLQAMQMAFKKVGEDGEGASHSVLHLQRSVAEAAAGGREAKEAFAELGLNINQLSTSNPAAQFRQVVDALAHIGNQGEKLRLAFSIFGREGGAAVVGAFRDGSKALDEMTAKAAKFGTLITPELAASGAQAKKAISEYGMVWEGMWTKITSHYAPDIAASFTMMSNAALQGSKDLGVLDVAMMGVNWLLNRMYDIVGGLKAGWDALGLAGLYAGKAIAKVIDLITGSDYAKEFSDQITKYTSDMLDNLTELGSDKMAKLKDKLAKERAAQLGKNQPQLNEPVEAGKAGTELIEKFKEEAATIGMTSRQAEIYRASLNGMTKAQYDAAQSLDVQLTALDVAKAYWDADPVNKASKSMRTYNTALAQGTITWRQYAELQDKAQTELTGYTDVATATTRRIDELTDAHRRHIITNDAYAASVRKVKEDLLGFSSPVDNLVQREDVLTRLMESHIITWADYTRAMDEAKRSMLGLAETPTSKLTDYHREIEQLADAWRKGKISADEYWDAVAKKQKDKLGIGASVGQQAQDFVRQRDMLRGMRDKGEINGSQYIDELKKSAPEAMRNIIESSKTPLQKFQEQLRDLKEWAATGLISPEVAARQMANMKKELGLGEAKFASVSEMGSTEARTDIMNWRNQGAANDPNVQILDIEKQSFVETKQQTGFLKQLATSGTQSITVVRM